MANTIWKVVSIIDGNYNKYLFYNKNNAIEKGRRILRHVLSNYKVDETTINSNIQDFGEYIFYYNYDNHVDIWLKEIEMEDSPELIVKLPDKGFLRAEIGADPDYPSIITSYSLDGDEWTQDLCMAEQKQDKKDIDVYVWADANDEDYTYKYEVGKFNEELWLR